MKKVHLFLCRLIIILTFITHCKKNVTLESPLITGPIEGFVSEEDTFYVTSIDPDTDSFAYLIDWGDGSFSRWSEFYGSSDTVQFYHKFACENIYSVKALAKNTDGDTSIWSIPHQIKIFSELNIKWSFPSPMGAFTELWSLPAAIGSHGTVYVVLDWTLCAVDYSGVLKWSKYFPDYPLTTPSIAIDGTVYIGVGNNQFIALNSDGSIKWSYSVASPTAGSIANDGTIYFGSLDSCVYALNPNGTLKWSYRVDGRIYATPIIGVSGDIYFPADDGFYYAVSQSGTLLWKIRIPSSSYFWHNSGAIASDGTIYILPNEDALYAIKSDGFIKWHISVENYIYSNCSPVIGSDGTVYVAGKNGLYAISPTGSVLWSYKGECWGTPAITTDGNILVPMNGEIYLIKCNGTGRSKTKITYKYPDGRIGTVPVVANDGTIYDIGYKEAQAILFAIIGNKPLQESPWPMYMHDARHTGCALNNK
jgi:hypothetical protein